MKSKEKPFKLILVQLFILFTCCYCTNGKDAEKTDEVKDVSIAGKIIEKKTCRTNTKHNYAYYLPSYYDANKIYPLIIAFDAHARGQLAVSRFKEAAETYGYIVVGSNNAKNGLQDINSVINSLWDDALSRFSVDPKRIYAAGFSGGARIASSLPIYKGGVKGVIACAGGMPQTGQELSKKFDFVGIVGLDDFNYLEMLGLDSALEAGGFVNRLITFQGGHEWPGSAILTKAVQWLDLMAMKQGLIPVNDNLVREYSTNYADSINQLIITDQNYKAYKQYQIFLKDLDGLYDISDYKKSFQELLKYPGIEEGEKADLKDKQLEQGSQEEILNMFKINSFAKIKNEISSLKKMSGQNHLSKRVLSFIGMLSYIFTEKAVNSQNKEAFHGYLEIYELIEPRNPDKEFFKACQATMDNNPDMAMQYLRKAIDYGYYDAEKLQDIGYFEQLRTMPEFDLIVKKAIENLKKE